MPVTSGIPKGSVLATVMFVVFINDLPEVVLPMTQMFADDTKVYRNLYSEEDQALLIDDQDRLWQTGGSCASVLVSVKYFIFGETTRYRNMQCLTKRT